MTKKEIEDELLTLQRLEQVHTLTIEQLTTQLHNSAGVESRADRSAVSLT